MRLKKLLLLVLVFVSAFTLTACKKDKVENLIIQSSTMDGVFNPFFYSSAYDGDVIGLVNASLLTLDRTSSVVAGDEYATVALDYSIYYTDNQFKKKDTFEAGDYVVYEIVLKNDAKFSDGRVITADDVLFNYYVYLDPAYEGSSTLYTLPILGLSDYRTQVPGAATYLKVIDAILADNLRGQDYVETDKYTEEQFDAYWAYFDEAGEDFAQEIIDYVKAKYLNDEYVAEYFHEDLKASDIQNDPKLQVAYGMAMWNFGNISDDCTKFTGASKTEYNVDDLSAAVFFDEMVKVYDGDYANMAETESAGSNFLTTAMEKFISDYKEEGVNVPNIAGLVKDQKVVDGVLHETVKVILTEQNPKAILSLGVTVAPKHYYTANYQYKTDTIVNYGVEFNSPDFMDHLESFNSKPMGAGPYKFVKRDETDGTVYLERNDYFETLGGDNIHNAYIKKVAFKIVDSGAEYSALEAGDVHYATVSATADVMKDIADQKTLASILVDNLGYGYICVNPEIYHNVNERIALNTLFDLSKVLDYYPNGLADIIYRSQSQVSWAYPEGAKAIYEYDETLAKAIEYFKKAGYTFDANNKVTSIPDNADNKKFIFYIPSAADAHPAGGVFLKTVDLLKSIGINAEVKTDADLIANIKKGAVGVYALAWQAAADPDMYQVYHYNSQAESVKSNGIKWLYENGDKDDWGTIEVTKRDGTKVTMNQKQALAYLGQLIEEGTKYMLPEERKPVYEKALEVLAQLAIEIPTYQRKNLFVYNAKVIDGSTLSQNVTPYWGPLAEIWKVKFAKGVTVVE